ncbi:MAG TPA: S41 family peptidase [Pyrinomonadaceae bacterium]|nr:S41 family peptidase [Pyrinomonadaceae bacterium]
MASSTNFGFEKVERLNGNIGYMELDGFVTSELGAETAIAAMQFLANTDALIIDLRYNGGGVPGTAQLIISYLFSETPVHYHSIVLLRTLNKRSTKYTKQHAPIRALYLSALPFEPARDFLCKTA